MNSRGRDEQVIQLHHTTISRLSSTHSISLLKVAIGKIGRKLQSCLRFHGAGQCWPFLTSWGKVPHLYCWWCGLRWFVTYALKQNKKYFSSHIPYQKVWATIQHTWPKEWLMVLLKSTTMAAWQRRRLESQTFQTTAKSLNSLSLLFLGCLPKNMNTHFKESAFLRLEFKISTLHCGKYFSEVLECLVDNGGLAAHPEWAAHPSTSHTCSMEITYSVH